MASFFNSAIDLLGLQEEIKPSYGPCIKWRFVKRVRLFMFIVLMSTSASASRLEPFGLQGMNITALAVTPIPQGIPMGSYLYAGTDAGGVFRRNLSSPDSGWVPIGLEGKKVTSLCVYHWGVGPADYNTLFAGVEPNRSAGDSTLLYRYEPEGKWQPADSGMIRLSTPGITAMAGFSYSGHEPPQPLFAGTPGHVARIYRSMNTGRYWQEVFSASGTFDDIQANQSGGHVWAGGGGSGDAAAAWMAKSIDSGGTWTATGPSNASNAVRAIAIHPDNVEIVFAGIEGAVIRTGDGGVTWDATGLEDEDVTFIGLAIDSADPRHIYAAGVIRGFSKVFPLWESFDSGATWQQIETRQFISAMTTIGADPASGNVLFIATQGTGVWRFQSGSFPPKVIRVPQDVPTIQNAIDSTADGDTVLVSPGVYMENIDFHGQNVVVKSLAGPAETIIDGGQKGSVVKFISGEDSTAILHGFTLRNGSGTAADDGNVYGGGLWCFSSSPTLSRNVIRQNMVLAGCGGLGGGIAVTGNGAPVIKNNSLHSNIATSVCDALVNYGGGIYVSGTSKARLSENTISHNSADFGGGIAVMDSARPIIRQNIISQNFRGGIVVSQAAQPIIGGFPGEGNDITGNDGVDIERRSPDPGQDEKINAQYNHFSICPPTEEQVSPLAEFDTAHCQSLTVATYFPLEPGNQWTFGESGTFTETIIDTFTLGKEYFFYRFDQFRGIEGLAMRLTEDNKLGYRLDTMSAIENTWVDFAADIGEQWTVSTSAETWTVRLESKTDTVTVPAGTFTNCHRFSFDWGCCDNSWVEWYAPGIGPVKRQLLGFAVVDYPLASATIHGIPVAVEEKPHDDVPVQFYLHQNYPNPFNSLTVIQYAINRKEHVKLAVYNLLGKEIAVLVDSQQPPGSHVVTWDGRDSSGRQVGSAVYFCKIQVGDLLKVRKMTLLR